MKRFAPILQALFLTLVAVAFVALFLYDRVMPPPPAPTETVEQAPADPTVCAMDDAECWSVCDPGARTCSILAKHARYGVRAGNLPCDTVTKISKAHHGSPKGTS